MGHVEELDDPPLALQLGQAPLGSIRSDHPRVVGDGHQQRPLVEVALACERIDFEGRPAGVRRVDHVAVVDDAFEDGEGPYPHDVQEHAAGGDPSCHPGEKLATAIEAALPGWVTASVSRLLTAWRGSLDERAMAAAADAGRRAAAEVGADVRALLLADVDEQRETPLTLLRAATRYPTAVLRAAGVPPVEREAYRAQAFPDDVYDLAPATWADVSPELTGPGLAWGAWKATAHKARHARR